MPRKLGFVHEAWSVLAGEFRQVAAFNVETEAFDVLDESCCDQTFL